MQVGPADETCDGIWLMIRHPVAPFLLDYGPQNQETPPLDAASLAVSAMDGFRSI